LKRESYENLPVWRCASCEGLWLDPQEFSTVLQHHEKKLTPQFVRETLRKAKAGIPPEELKKSSPCPVCSHAMTPRNYSYSSGVIIDMCHDHGIWFDRDELERIEAFHDEWEAKKDDIKLEYQASLSKVEQEYWRSYEQMRGKMRDKIYIRHSVFWLLDRLSQEIEYKMGSR
jgi:Zn-finger nucleic acid-binding protein